MTTNQRMLELRRRVRIAQQRNEFKSITMLSTSCAMLSITLLGWASQCKTLALHPPDISNMYGSVLLNESAGGYVI